MSVKNYSSEDLRRDYQAETLSLEQIAQHPLEQFEIWFNQALEQGVLEPNAMTLSTVSAAGVPSARIVLLKGFDANGFFFYTNYQSQKAQDIAQNPHVSLVFNWLQLERQVCIIGKAEKLTAEHSDSYYNKRPIGSRIGAWTSPQSQAIPSRDVLDKRLDKMQQIFDNKTDIPRPPFWGGYCVKPYQIEFWQGRSSRLHDRIVFELKHDTWTKKRVAP